MLTDPVHAEDHLIPFAASANAIAVFDDVDGVVRVLGGVRDVVIPAGPGQYAVPGSAAIVDAVVSDTRLSVAVRPLDQFPSPIRVRKFETEVPLGARVEGVVPGGEGWVVMRTAPLTVRVFSLGWSTEIDVLLTPTERIVAVWDDGRAVVQGAMGWRVGDAAVREGTVVSVGTEALVARVDPKERRVFRLMGASGMDRELIAPGGWRVEEAVVRGSSAVMSCLHPGFGYGLWDGSTFERVDGSIELFSIGGRDPVVRTTGTAVGSNWRVGASVIPGTSSSRPDLKIEPRVLDGLPTVLISGKSVRGLVVALHGGPDSLEWDNLRYGGLYRMLADVGLATLIVNGPGSRGFGRSLQEEGWGDWTSAAARIAGVGRRVARLLDVRLAAVLGVSFGAWLAVQAADALGVARVVAASPVLDLTTHIRAHNVTPEYEVWARRRFGVNLERAVTGDRAGGECKTAVTVVLPESDRVVNPARTAAVASERGWQIVSVPEGHVPTTAAGAALRWASIRRALIGSI